MITRHKRTGLAGWPCPLQRLMAGVFALAILIGGAGLLPPSAVAQTATPAPATAPASPAAPAAGAPSPVPAPAPEAKSPTPTAIALPPEMLEPVDRLAKSIKGAETAIQHFDQLEDELAQLRTNVESILGDAQQTAEGLRPRLADIKAQIEHLGPLPGAGQPPEAASVAADRERLNIQAAQLGGAIKSTELTWVRARQLIEKITVMRHALFTRNLLERLPSPLLPALWHDVFSDSPAVGRRLTYLSQDWWSWGSQDKTALSLLALAAAAIFFACRAGVVRLIEWGMRGVDRNGHANGGDRTGGTATFFERAVAVGWMAPLRMLPGALAALAVYGGLEQLELLFAPWDRLGAAVVKAVLAFIAIATLIEQALAPNNPGWRLVPLANGSVGLINRLLQAMVLVYAVDFALTQMSRAFFVPLALSVVQSFVLSLTFAGLLMALAATRFHFALNGTSQNSAQPNPGLENELTSPAWSSRSPVLPRRRVSRTEPRWLKVPMWALAIGIVIPSVLGYVSLGRFVAHQLVLTSMVCAVVGLCYLAIRALTRPRADGKYAVSDTLEQRLGLDPLRQRQLARVTEVALTCGLIVLALPLLLLQWGFAGADIQDWFQKAIFGFEVGHLRISLARIVLGALLFAGLMFLTRLMQKWLRDGVLGPTRMDSGIANSIDQAFGYIGIALAALIAVSYAGFDVTNLAIVAGALSVGIGFGLQSIVNNFVSGLILLVERPIKVGDWVVVGDQQGNVRRISVRSTEIETFDKASLIVPNSELISGRVLNWTHRNLLGRVVIRFTLDGNADPEEVIRILVACARANPQVMATPPPLASLDQFSTVGLDFSLRATISDITRSLPVLTDLRIAILKELRRSGQMVAAAPIPVMPPQLVVAAR